MPMWPFGRKKRRTSATPHPPAAEPTPDKTTVSGARRDLSSPAAAARAPLQPPPPPPPDRRDSQRRRKQARRVSEQPAATVSDEKRAVRAARRGSVQDITALPGMKKLEASPHLRPANAHKPIIPYTLDRGPVSSPTRDMPSSPAIRASQSPRTAAPQRRRSDRRREQSLREEEIRAMSAPMQVPKRPAGVNNDLLRRDSKKARRTFSTKRSEDNRGSNVSLPFQDSIHSSMSGQSEQRGWAVSAIDVFSPRPTVRLSGAGYSPHQTGHSSARLSRKGSKKERLPAIAQDTDKKDRRRIAHLADDLDASELRIVMERDQRRREQKEAEQQQRLDRKLRRRADKQRAEEERRIREARERAVATPPTATHPAFRNDRSAEILDEAVSDGPLTPMSTKEERSDAEDEARGRPKTAKETYLNYSTLQEHPATDPFDDPEEQGPFADPLPIPSSPDAEFYPPGETPMEEPIIETAKAVRLSQGHMSPPNSPLRTSQPTGSLSDMSDLQQQRTSSIPSRPVAPNQRRPSETSSRRAGTWATLFRRGPSSRRGSDEPVGRSMPSESSFVNTSRDFSFANASRESMSRQIPAHLVQQPGTRRSGTPVRTQSRFREDLPELPLSPPDSRVQSPELTIAAANAAAARRAKRSAGSDDERKESARHESVDTASSLRKDSPVIPERQDSIAMLSRSLASVDSEGSWISGRPSQRTSSKAQLRESAGSLTETKDEFNASYDKLPVPDHEYFSTLTPHTGSRRPSGEDALRRTDDDDTPTGPATGSADDGTPLRQGTARRRPTVVHNDPRLKSREALMADYQAGEVVTSQSREGSPSGDSAENSPIERSYLHNARSVNYGSGHAKTLSAGSAKLLEIAPSSKRGSARPSPQSSPPPVQTEFRRPSPSQ
ncbi:hypothetical protein MBLNU459_g1226t1 [Dothideomycetes sp. NU459]